MRKPTLRYLPLVIVIIVSSFLLIPASSKSIAALEAVVWSTINVPTEGSSGQWQLAAGSDVRKVTAAGDGSLYAYASPAGSNNTLFKSTDKGLGWASAGQVSDNIVALAIASDDSRVVYYATNSTVYRSTNGGANFSALAANPGGAGSNNVTITCLAVTLLNNSRLVAVGTRDWDSGQFGGVYTLNESEPAGDWSDTGLRNCDVLSVAFSPGYAVDRQLIAMGSSENGTLVAFRSGVSEWGTSSGNATISGFVPQNCVAAFPEDYDSTFFLGIDTGNGTGDVFRINRVASPGSSTAIDLNVGAGENATGLDVSGLAVSGSSGAYYILAGAADSTTIYISSSSGQNWTRSSKTPTGESGTIIAMAPDFAGSRRVYAGSSGAGSAFSYSVDAGITWNQLSMIDTRIDAIVDLTVSPNYGQDNTLFLLTWGGEHSLWRTQNSGGNWERVYTGSQGGASTFSHLGISPQYGASESVIVLAGTSGSGAIWKSNDKGQTFVRRSTGFAIDTLALASNDQYFMGSHNGTNNLVYRTTDSGVSYYSPAAAGSQPLSSIKLSPGFPQDGTILAGNTNGWVFLSTDSGASFQEIPGGSGSPPLAGSVFVAFDNQFQSSRIIYAASDTVATSLNRSRLFRHTLGTGQKWDSLDAALDTGGSLRDVLILPGGCLYVANSQDNSGMQRALTAGTAGSPVFEQVNTGLFAGAALTGLWSSGNQLWSLDTRNLKLMTYVDTLSSSVVATEPENDAGGVDPRNVTIAWDPIDAASTYEWQISFDSTFFSVPGSLNGVTGALHILIPRLDSASTYYWRVRVKEPTLSPWSDVRCFYTRLGAAGSLPALNSPKAAATDVSLRPTFQWAAISGAERYELLVATNLSFIDPVIAKVGSNSLTVNAWQCDIPLSYNTTYFWKIRGISVSSSSVWSGIGVFKTVLPPPVPSPPLVSNKVALLSPKQGVQGVGVKPVFEWGSVPGASRYELLVSANSSFSDAVIAKVGADALSGTVWQSDVSLQYGTTYYWKVRDVNGSNVSAWSDVNSFTTIQPEPAAPARIVIELKYPMAGAEGVSIKPIFEWKTVTGAERYELLVSINSSFSDPVIAKAGIAALPAEVWQSDVNLAYKTTYFWKVRAVIGGNASAWSDISAFITTGPPAPAVTVIELENPAAGAEGVSLKPVFQWKTVAGTDRYELLVSTSYTFTEQVISKSGNDALSVNAWRCDVSLSSDTMYYWKVRGISITNVSAWSSVFAFTTLSPAPQAEAKLAVEPALPRAELESPLNASGRTSTKPSYVWKAVPGAEKYELLVSPDIAFTRPVITRVGSYALPDTSWESEVELNYDTTYWWKVRAVSGNRSAEWSVPGVFITEPRPPSAVAADRPVLPSWAIYAGISFVAVIVILCAALVMLLMRIKSG